MPKANDETRFVRRVLIVVALAALVVLAWVIADVLLLAFAALLLAIVLRAISEPLAARLGTPPGATLTGVVLATIALASLALWQYGPNLAREATSLSRAVPAAWDQLTDRLGATGLGEDVIGWVRAGGDLRARLISGARLVAVTLVNAVTGIILVLGGGIYLAYEPTLYRDGLLELVPGARRSLGRELAGDVGRALRLWLLGQLVSMSLVGVLTSLGLVLIGVPSPVALGMFAALAEFIPVIGPILAAVPALLLALVQGTDVALWTLVLYVGIQQIESNVLMPLIQKRALALPPALLLFAVVAAGYVFGVLGVVLAAPSTVVAFVAVKRLYVQQALHTPSPVPGRRHMPAK